MTPDLLDMTALDDARTTMKQKFPLIIEYFLEDAKGYMAQIEQAANAGTAEAMVMPAHTLKSSSKQVGGVKLSECAEDVEKWARGAETPLQDFATLVPRLERLRAIFAATQEALLRQV